MRKTFQIIFCVCSALSVCASPFFGIFLGWAWFFAAVGGAAIFAALMLLVKNGNPFRRRRTSRVDFMNTDEENEEIRRAEREQAEQEQEQEQEK